MRIAFLGSQEIGARCLQVMIDQHHDIVAVGTFEPAAHESWDDAVARLAGAHDMPLLRDPRFRTPDTLEELRTASPDIMFVIGWRWILGPEVIEIPPRGTLGIHGSLLPRLHGFAPLNWALINGERETGPTLFYFDDGCDTGDIVDQTAFPIGDTDDVGTLRTRLADASVDLLARNLPLLAAGTAPRRPQRHEEATFGPQRRPGDGRIDWTRSTKEIVDWVRGLTRPYPGAFTVLDGVAVPIWRVTPAAGQGRPGRLLTAEPLVIATGDGAVQVLDLGPAERPDQVLRSTLVARGGFDAMMAEA